VTAAVAEAAAAAAAVAAEAAAAAASRWSGKRGLVGGKVLFDQDSRYDMSSGLASCNLQGRQLLNCPAEVLLRSTVLTSLNLSRNKIVTLPRNINCLSILKSFELDCNELEQVPHEIGYIHTLQNLSIRNNVLISVPRSFGLLTSIKSLYLSANNLSTIPPELFVHLPRCDASFYFPLPLTFTSPLRQP
jgi:Leucine-rich repeat (LRR) protein